jgi:hypothetical protein
MATISTKFEKGDQVFLKYDGKLHGGIITFVEISVGWFTRIRYCIQTGMESGIDNIPEEHLFTTSKEAELDKDWESGIIRFNGYN